MNTVYSIYVHVSLWDFLKGLVTVFTFKWATFAIGFLRSPPQLKLQIEILDPIEVPEWAPHQVPGQAPV